MYTLLLASTAVAYESQEALPPMTDDQDAKPDDVNETAYAMVLLPVPALLRSRTLEVVRLAL